FELTPITSTVVASIGAFTAILAASIALVQTDIKRVLAYSTVSQLGYMFLAAGVGAYSAAIFHMVTHAFFKALLFLGAGSVIHSLHHEQDMRRMGGLRKFLPITAGTFIVGWLAIAGIVPFAGFWSKDEILAKAWFTHDYALWAIGVAGALLTAFYMTRQVWLVFYGPERWQQPAEAHADDPHEAPPAEADSHEAPEHHEAPHESPWVMTFPLVALAGLSFIGGLIDLPFTNSKINLLDRWLDLPEAHAATSFGAAFALSTIAVIVGVTGIAFGYRVYRRGLDADGRDPGVERLGGAAPVLEHAYYIDDGVARAVSGPVMSFARGLSNGVDRNVIDGAVNGIGNVARAAGGGLRRVQTGLVRNYALAIFAGTAVLLVYVATRVSF
ncbi:MAG TPA: proton-conducting transporter membrane subunit, partial [Acidimicrobiia bacterium]|nr:proton-conducting transporter membrane subunit [Acidimicrobiia bacterium]